MNRSELEFYITETYSAEGEHLFAQYSSFLVFRHKKNRKWFAVIMDIPGKNLGLTGEGQTQVVNLKCDTRLIGSFLDYLSIFPGWHMNKAHWLSVALDGTVSIPSGPVSIPSGPVSIPSGPVFTNRRKSVMFSACRKPLSLLTAFSMDSVPLPMKPS